MIHGTAKIVTNEGGGKYTITQTFVDTSDDTFKAGSVGLVDVEAWDVNLDTTRVADDPVTFQIQETYDGKSVPIINGSGFGGGIGSGPMRLDKWYFIEANQAWTTIDTRDWGGRWLWINLIHDPGELNEFDEQYAEHWDANAGAYAAQDAHTWFRVMLNSSDAEQEISRVIHGVAPNHDGDFYLRMKTDGNLEILVENYEAEFSVRFSIMSTAAIPEVETID